MKDSTKFVIDRMKRLSEKSAHPVSIEIRETEFNDSGRWATDYNVHFASGTHCNGPYSEDELVAFLEGMILMIEWRND